MTLLLLETDHIVDTLHTKNATHKKKNYKQEGQPGLGDGQDEWRLDAGHRFGQKDADQARVCTPSTLEAPGFDSCR